MKNLKNYGIVKMQLLKRTDLTVKEKMVYAIIAVKQGTTDHAKLTNRKIADALDISIQHTRRIIIKLRTIRILKKEKIPDQFSISNYATKNKQYGVVEIDMLITNNLSLYAKYLYTIYCVVGNSYNTNNWSRDAICKQFKMGKSKYYEAHSELIKKTVLVTQGSAKGNGIQSSNYNKICRAENYDIQKPASWLKKNYKVVDLKYIGKYFEFPKRVYTPRTPIGDDWLYENVFSGQPEGTDGDNLTEPEEDNLEEQEETTEGNGTGQRIVTNTTLTNITDTDITGPVETNGLTNQTVLDPEWLLTEEGTAYVGKYIEESFGYLRLTKPIPDEAERLFNIIYKLAKKYSMKNLKWNMSVEDKKFLYKILEYWEDLYELPNLIGEGFVKCFKGKDWRFGQIIYRAHTAIVNYEMQGYADSEGS